MKKILLIIAYILIWIISAQGAPKTIKKTFPKGSGFIEVSGYFEKGELTTGPLKVWYKSTKNGITRVLLEGHYNAELAQFKGTILIDCMQDTGKELENIYKKGYYNYC